MAAVRHLGFAGRVFGPPTKTTWWFVKYSWNCCSTFDNMKVLIFRMFGFKTHIHARKIVFWGDLTPLVRSNGCERIFLIREHLAKLQAKWLIVSYTPFALRLLSSDAELAG